MQISWQKSSSTAKRERPGSASGRGSPPCRKSSSSACRQISAKTRRRRRSFCAAVDVAILCLPDEAAREAVALASALGDAGPRILDASTAHRVSEGWAYGFPELTAEQPQAIARAKRVANPGCYATGTIALLRPLTDAGILPPDHRSRSMPSPATPAAARR